jgi:CBS domain-containing protein
VGKKIVPASVLIQEDLMAVARSGLTSLGIRVEDIDRYLGIIEKRVSARQTGSDWLLRSHAAVRTVISSSKSAGFLTAAALENQESGSPVHEWPIPEAGTIRDMRDHHRIVEQFMTTDLLTVNEDDPVELVLSIMHWRRVRHLPVEDNNHRLKGLVDYRSLIKLFVERGRRNEASVPVRDIMQTDVPTIQPTTTTVQAIELMCRKGATCLPVVQDGCLVGLITQNDIVHIAAQFLEGGLGAGEEGRTWERSAPGTSKG